MILNSNPCLNLHPPSILKTPCKFCGIFLSRSFTRFFHNGSNHWRSSPFLAHLLRNWAPQGWIAMENYEVKIYKRHLPSRIFWKAAQPSYLLSRTQLLTFQLLAMFNSKPGFGWKLILYLVPKLIFVIIWLVQYQTSTNSKFGLEFLKFLTILIFSSPKCNSPPRNHHAEPFTLKPHRARRLLSMNRHCIIKIILLRPFKILLIGPRQRYRSHPRYKISAA